jgi:FMN phosphatase YigB (HAD superfamily)
VRPTILIDLDDTLLDNDIRIFLPAYLQALSGELASLAEPQKVVSTLLAATKAMVENRRPDCTLKDVFDVSFYPVLKLDPALVQSYLDRFYANNYPALQGLTRPRPQSIRLVEDAMQRGYRVVIATNPLFPRTAILQRLAWAGLPYDKYPFDLVTSYETFHFSKPHAAYYAEIMARLGWPDGPVVMLGNDLHNDISPARQLGLAAFQITGANQSTQDSLSPYAEAHNPTAAGRLEDFLPWQDSLSVGSLQPDYTSPYAMQATLLSTPAALDSLSRNLVFADWCIRPTQDEWSPTEILCHLRDVEREVNLPRLQMVLKEKNPFLPGMDTDPWAEERRYITQSGPHALHKFTAARLELLDLLRAASPEDWQRPARHAIFGPTHLAEIVSIIAGHDRLHIQQFKEDFDTLSIS